MRKKALLIVSLLCLCGVAHADSKQVKVVKTAVGGPYLQQITEEQTTIKPTNGVLRFRPDTRYQDIDGFGAAMTYSSCYNLLKMSDTDRDAFLKKTFSDAEGFGYSYVRISIGCNDFSSTEYSLCDVKGPASNLLQNFRLHNDETQYVIPILKRMLEINPNVKIIATPWTCPKWMKVSDINTKTLFSSWTDGHLNPDYRATYADYFVKFVRAFEEQGITIYAVSPQNEPLNKGNSASLYMPWQEQAPFVKELARAFNENNLSTKIYLFDHNYNYDGDGSQEDYPIKVYNQLGDSYVGSELVVGSAYHDYGGTPDELTDIHDKRADKELIFTETSLGEWNDGRNLSRRLMEDMKNIVLATVNRWCRAVVVWNLMLDVNKGPNRDGGCQTCYGCVDLQLDNKTINYNSHYYILAQMSSVVKPGAVRIGTSRFSQDNVQMVAFQNVDGTYALVVCNDNSSAISIPVSNGTTYYTLNVPAKGISSMAFLSEPTEEDPTVPDEVVPAYEGELYIIGEDASIGATHYGTSNEWSPSRAIFVPQVSAGHFAINLTAGEQLNPTFVNFKFFMQAGWGDEYQGSANAKYNISTESDLVYIGDGTSATSPNDNGNIYLRPGQQLTPGTVYEVSVDATDKFHAILGFAPYEQSTAIQSAPDNGLQFRQQLYDLQGRRLSSSSSSLGKGIYIVEGKKIIK